MSVKLTCPVCERSQIEANTCPNCETDLSTYRMLAELPIETKEQKRTIPIWLPVGIATLFLLLGIGLGFAGNSVIAKQQPQTTPTSTTASNQTSETKPDQLVVSPTVAEKPESKSCGGFNYVVRKGDSLSLIASRLYGDINSWSLISEANPAIQGRESSIEIGEFLFVPNLKNNC